MTFKQLVEHIGLIPRDLEWLTHFPATKKQIGPLLNATAEIEYQLGRDGADLISRIVDGKTGKPGRAYFRWKQGQADRAPLPDLTDDE